MPWVAPKTDFVNGDVLTATQMNNIGGDLAMFNGGTTGQVLSKASNANGDFAWTSETDPNAIPKTLIDAKGDLIAGSAADTAARLAVGTNGQVLTADSTTATGLKWAAAASGATLNWQQFTSSGTFTVPAGVTKVWVEVLGGGGGGGNVDGSYNGWNTWTQGGGGGSLLLQQVTVTPGASVTVTVGAGGAGGSAGSASSFGALSASGGIRGGRLRNIVDAEGGVGAGNGGAGSYGNSAAANSGAGGGGINSSSGTGGSGGSGRVTIFWAS